MKKIHYFIIATLIAVMGILAACHENVFDETNGSSSEIGGNNNVSTTVSVEVSIDGINIQNENYRVNTLLDDIILSQSNGEIESIMNDLPQLFFVSDNTDKIILMSRFAVSKNSKVFINEETTALALATLNPLFANTNNEGIIKIENLIKNTSSFATYLDLVKKTISRGEEVFNVDNVELLVALNNVLEEVCLNIDTEKHHNRAIFTRASNIVGISPDPLSVQTSGIDVSIRNKGLIPTYECQLYYGGRLIDTRLIESHKAYGFLDLFSIEEDLIYGAEEKFTLSNEGEYRFYFDRTTERAINDFSRRMWGDVLSMIGLYNSGELLEISASLYGTLGPLLANPDTDITDCIKAIGGLVINTGFGLRWPAAGAVLNKFNVLYNVLKGFSNEVARSILGFTAPHYVDFCLCSYNYSITSCTETELVKVDGDNQEGFSRQRLLLPLTVSTKFFADDGTEIERSTYQKVKFEVIAGGGSVSNEIVGTETNSQLASTYWTLGNEGEQTVKAVIIDMVTGVQVSEPVYFTAKLRENADLTIRLDWNKLSGNTDIDLHVTDPYGEEIAYYNMNSASGGRLDRDDVIGPGPEHIYWSNAPSGAYLVQVHYYGSETGAVTSYSVSINAKGETYGPFKGSIGDQQLITIGVLNLPDGTFTRSSTNSVFFNKQFKVEENIVFPAKK